MKRSVETKETKIERYIYQHPKEKTGTWQKAMIVITCPYNNSRYITSYFDQGKQIVHDYQNPIFWLTKDQVSQLISAAEKNGYRLISNEHASNYGI